MLVKEVQSWVVEIVAAVLYRAAVRLGAVRSCAFALKLKLLAKQAAQL